MKKVFAVIVNYKGERNTIELLESFMKLNRSEFELHTVIVNNSPQEPIRLDENKYLDLGLKVIFNKENLGFSGGNNVGIKYSLEQGADFILIINDDTVVDGNLINELIKGFDSKDSVGVVVPKIYFAKGFEFHDRYKQNELGKVIWYAGGLIDWANVVGVHRGVDEVDKGQYDDVTRTELATGCCMLVKSEVFKKVGFYDEKYFLYYEDTDLSQRIKKAGFEIIFQPSALVWHKNAQSTGGSGSNLQDYFTTRNRLLFGLNYAPFRSRAALIRESMRLIRSGRQWQKKGAKDYYLHRFGKGRMDL